MKCGTSSLHYYLSLHPDVSMSKEKELNFFEREWERGLEWYESQFESDAIIRGESSPNYTKFPRHGSEAPARMQTVIPDARLIYLVRDPIDRIVSHYVDAYSFGRVNGSLLDELQGPEGEHYVNTSRYAMQLQRYLNYFDPSQILVVTSEALRDSRRDTLGEVFRFLGIDDAFWTPEYEVALNAGAEKRRGSRAGYAFERLVRRTRDSRIGRHAPRSIARPIRRLHAMRARAIETPSLDDRLRDLLRARLRDDVDALRGSTGKPFAEWSL